MTDNADTDEIEITDAMIEAGIKSLHFWVGTFDRQIHRDREIVREIFERMWALRHSDKDS